RPPRSSMTRRRSPSACGSGWFPRAVSPEAAPGVASRRRPRCAESGRSATPWHPSCRRRRARTEAAPARPGRGADRGSRP
ncbi:MAG: hypothetical protein ACK56I_16765, partial [bacterium]